MPIDQKQRFLMHRCLSQKKQFLGLEYPNTTKSFNGGGSVIIKELSFSPFSIHD